MKLSYKIFFVFALYAIFSIIFFVLHILGLPGKHVWESWALLIITSGISFSFGFLTYYIFSLSEIFQKIYYLGAFALVFFIILFFIMPHPQYILDDTNIYYFHAKIFIQYQENPYIHEPWEFSRDPDFVFIKMWENQNYNYGPFWLLLSSLPLLLTKSILIASAIYKYLALLFFLGSLYILHEILDRDIKKVFLFGINPLVLYWGITGAHNDMAMVFFMLLSLFFLKKAMKDTSGVSPRRLHWAIFLLALAVLIKYIAILFLPLMLAYIYKRWKVWALIYSFIIFSIFIVVSYAPFQIGLDTILGNKTLILPRLGGPLFTGAYAIMNFGIEMNNQIFSKVKNIFFTLFIFGYGIIFLRSWKKLSEIKDIFHAAIFILLWFYFVTYWFQAWYLIWIIPFFSFRDNIKNAIAISALIWYGLTFYFLSYLYTSALGLILALSLFFPIFLFFSYLKKNCFFGKKLV